MSQHRGRGGGHISGMPSVGPISSAITSTGPVMGRGWGWQGILGAGEKGLMGDKWCWESTWLLPPWYPRSMLLGALSPDRPITPHFLLCTSHPQGWHLTSGTWTSTHGSSSALGATPPASSASTWPSPTGACGSSTWLGGERWQWRHLVGGEQWQWQHIVLGR